MTVTVTKVRSYPREVVLAGSGIRVDMRPLEEGDAHELLQFFLRVPEEDRFYLKEDVTSPEVICNWVHDINWGRVFPLVAIVDGRIVADATLHRRRAPARRHVGEIRIVVDPGYRRQGIGTLLIRELNDIAFDNGLERVVFELVEGKEDEAIEVAQRLGFTRTAVLLDHVKDMEGKPHDLIIMELPLDIWPDWWEF